MSGNQANRGAGVFVNMNSSAILSNVRLVDHHTDPDAEFGGGLYAHLSDVTLSNVVVGRNHAAYGAGLYLLDANAIIHNSIFGKNKADGNGGAIAVEGGSVATLTNVTLANNNAYGSGGGVYVLNSSATLTNCSMWWNDTGTSPGFHAVTPILASISYSNVDDPVIGPVTMSNIISHNRGLLLTWANYPDWDLHFASTFPFVDAGNPSILDPDGSRSDIGVYGGPGADDWDLDGDRYSEWWEP
ncbi:MAG: hypothetical protein GY700_06115, partial [Propionibacteriaceae bacterium]|nr:hypothetical protein [Propionibacteriaceae bacterium]